MEFWRSGRLRCSCLLVLAGAFSSCGLVKAPFRVAGALTNGAYQGGKKVAKSTSAALESRKERKAKEEEEAAKAKARKESGEPVPTNPEGPVDQPIIPLEDPSAIHPPLPTY